MPLGEIYKDIMQITNLDGTLSPPMLKEANSNCKTVQVTLT
jgi:hypothetical protein